MRRGVILETYSAVVLLVYSNNIRKKKQIPQKIPIKKKILRQKKRKVFSYIQLYVCLYTNYCPKPNQIKEKGKKGENKKRKEKKKEFIFIYSIVCVC